MRIRLLGTGTPSPSLARMGSRARGEGNCSGWFADDLKKSGYDALVVEGASDEPVYIWINDKDVDIRTAESLWGKWTFETEKLIKREVGVDASVVAEGPAAENLVTISAVTHTAHRAAGRTGLGAVMGSKKLKAIAAQGTGKVSVSDPEKVAELRTKIAKETFEAEFTTVLRDHGQAGFVMDLHNDGILPTRNFKSGIFEGANKISGQTITETILKGREACPRCPVACKRIVEITEGPFAPVRGARAFYARIYHDVDGYKTIHIWCLYEIGGVPPLVDVDFSYPGIGSLIQVYTFSTTEFGTYDVIAPEISFQIIARAGFLPHSLHPTTATLS